jgi:hypothetical protein
MKGRRSDWPAVLLKRVPSVLIPALTRGSVRRTSAVVAPPKEWPYTPTRAGSRRYA